MGEEEEGWISGSGCRSQMIYPCRALKSKTTCKTDWEGSERGKGGKEIDTHFVGGGEESRSFVGLYIFSLFVLFGGFFDFLIF